jgi:ATP-binding cassette, subfamily B, bacterial
LQGKYKIFIYPRCKIVPQYQNISFIIKALKPALPRLLFILCLILTWTFSETLLFYMLKWIIDSFSSLSPLSNSWLLYFGAFVIIVLLIEASITLANYIHAKLVPHLSLILRQELTNNLLHKDLIFFNNEKVGDLTSRIAELPSAVENIIKIILYGIIAGSFGFFTTSALVAMNLGFIALYFLIWYALMMLIGGYFIKQTIKLSHQFAHSLNNANAELTELLQNILNIKVAAQEGFECERIKKDFQLVRFYQTQLEMLSFKTSTLRSIISALLLIGLFGFVLLKVSTNNASMGDLVFITSSAFIARRDIWRVSLQLTEIYKDFGFIKEIGNIVTFDKPTNKSPKTQALKQIKSIQLNSVSFGFPGNPLVLQDINLKILKGTKVALVGSSGVGKTTLAKVLQGMYTINQGQILINNINQAAYSAHSIMEHITYISQEPVLFNRTIKENITYLNSKIDAKSLAKIAKVTLCDDFIQKLPHKYDTVLTNLGNDLSAGQKQRIAVARALCSKAKWIILDEPSSALDTATEMQLIKNLLAFCKDRTLIIITHNPQIMKLMDKILLLQNGCIIAKGSHDEMKSKPLKSFKSQV